MWWGNDKHFVANSSLNPMVKGFKKSTNIWQSYQKMSLVFFDSHCTYRHSFIKPVIMSAYELDRFSPLLFGITDCTNNNNEINHYRHQYHNISQHRQQMSSIADTDLTNDLYCPVFLAIWVPYSTCRPIILPLKIIMPITQLR